MNFQPKLKCSNCEGEIWTQIDLDPEKSDSDSAKEICNLTTHRPVETGKCDVLLKGKKIGFSRAKFTISGFPA